MTAHNIINTYYTERTIIMRHLLYETIYIDTFLLIIAIFLFGVSLITYLVTKHTPYIKYGHRLLLGSIIFMLCFVVLSNYKRHDIFQHQTTHTGYVEIFNPYTSIVQVNNHTYNLDPTSPIKPGSIKGKIKYKIYDDSIKIYK